MNNQQLILLLSLDLPVKLSKEQSKQLADEFTFMEKRIAELEQAIMSNCYDDPSTSGKRLMALVTKGGAE